MSVTRNQHGIGIEYRSILTLMKRKVWLVFYG